ncbi:MAG: hypothetical protein V4689_18585 [Verrucomicrobiota bacterium]
MNTKPEIPNPASAEGRPLNSEPPVPLFRRIGSRLRNWPIIGMIAGAAWFLILAIGVLIPSEGYRKELGWVPEKSEKLDEQKDLLEKVEKLIKENVSQTAPDLSDSPTPAADPAGKALPEEINEAEVKCTQCCASAIKKGELCHCGDSQAPNPFSKICPFLIAAVSFLPLNICLLTILAAFIGGCAINKGELKDLGELVGEHNATGTRTAEADRDRKRYNYLCEHPGYSALRGLIVFLVIVSGLLLAGGTSIILEGSQTEQLTQYFRLAGIFSFFGYLAGSDPTLFASMIEFGSARIRQSGTTPTPAPPVPVDAAATAAAAAAAATAAAARITADNAAETVEAVNAVNAANAAEDAAAEVEENTETDDDSPTSEPRR